MAQPSVIAGAYAATVGTQVAILTVLNAQIETMQGEVEAHFGRHPDAEIYRGQPELGARLGAMALVRATAEATDNDEYDVRVDITFDGRISAARR